MGAGTLIIRPPPPAYPWKGKCEIHRKSDHSGTVCPALQLLLLLALCLGASGPGMAAPRHDVVIRGGTVYDGSGGKPYPGEVAIDDDRIAYVGPPRGLRGRIEIDATGKAVAPGFINMLSWSNESLLHDGLGQSELRQGVTLQVMGEGWSMGPLNERMKELAVARQIDIHYPVDWTTLGEYLAKLEARGVAQNVASFVGATTVREYVLGERDVQPTAAELDAMRSLVRQAMEEGALGVGSSLIYAPASYAKTPELVALVTEAGRCGGMYITHMRSEGDRVIESVQETIDIARQSGAPAEIYHLKLAGRGNWGKLDEVIAMIEAARRSGVRITTDMYTYVGGATGLDAAMPPWVQDGGLEAWIERLRDPAGPRARHHGDARPCACVGEPARARRRRPDPAAQFQEPEVEAADRPYAGFGGQGARSVAGGCSHRPRDRGRLARRHGLHADVGGERASPGRAALDELRVRRGGHDARGRIPAVESAPARLRQFRQVLARYVRDEHAITLEDAVRRLSALPAQNLAIADRGMLKDGYFADVVVFDPQKIQDHATFEKPHQFATGVSEVLVNGQLALKAGVPTGATAGRFVRGRAWTGHDGGGCRASSRDWPQHEFHPEHP